MAGQTLSTSRSTPSPSLSRTGASCIKQQTCQATGTRAPSLPVIAQPLGQRGSVNTCRQPAASELLRCPTSSLCYLFGLHTSYTAGVFPPYLIMICSSLVRAEEILKVIRDVGPKKFVALLTDGASNMNAARQLVIAEPLCKHIISLRSGVCPPLHQQTFCFGAK